MYKLHEWLFSEMQIQEIHHSVLQQLTKQRSGAKACQSTLTVGNQLMGMEKESEDKCSFKQRVWTYECMKLIMLWMFAINALAG